MTNYWPQWKIYLYKRLADISTDQETWLSVDNFFVTSSDRLSFLNELFELNNRKIIELHLKFTKNYFIETQAKLRASTIGSHATIEKNYGLGEELFTKVCLGSELNHIEIDRLLRTIPVQAHDRHSNILYVRVFPKVDSKGKKELYRLLSEYLDKFQSDDLTTGTPHEPECFVNQASKFITSFFYKYKANMTNKQAIKLTEIWSEDNNVKGNFWS